MRLLLHSLKLSEQEDRGIFDGVLLAEFEGDLRFLLDEMGEDGVVDGKAVDGVELLDEFEAHGAPHPAVPDWRQAYM
jgi:hypothetical protein